MIVCLDFDGVLHPDTSRSESLFCRMDLLERWLREHACVDVVISSTWREVYPFKAIVDFFADDLRGRVVGATPVMSEGAGWWYGESNARWQPYHREAEIRHWVRSSWEPWRPWVALDDRADLFSPMCPQLVLCDRTTGLTTSELLRLERLLASG